MTVTTRVLCLLIGYVFGLFQTAFIYGKLHGVDIRKVGSGNAGTTNALRNFGTKAGLLVFVGDLLKCIAAILVTRALFAGGDKACFYLVCLWTGLGCVLGHNFPFYMNFKGGKGIACTGAIVIMFSWQLAVIGFAVFFVCVILTHFVSLGSLLGVLTVFVGAVILGASGSFGLTHLQYVEMVIVFFVIMCLAFYQHRQNIVRLIRGNERKTYFGGKT